MKIERLLEPISLGGIELRNRLMMTTHGPRLAQNRYLAYLAERAKSGVALFGVSAATGIYEFPTGPMFPVVPGFEAEADGPFLDPLSPAGIAHYDRIIPVLAAQADAVHAHDSRAVGQLYHPGSGRHGDDFQPASGASVVLHPDSHELPHVLTTDEIERLVAAFGQGGRRVREAGLDGVEIHGAHGYLIHQFLSPVLNLREDGYGGGVDKRVRLLLEIIAAVRGATGGDFPIGVRLDGGRAPGFGLEVEDIVEIAGHLAPLGLAYLSISGGTYTGGAQAGSVAYVASGRAGQGPNVPAARAVRAATGIPVVVGGRITDPAFAERVVAEGSADVVGMVRGLIADPAFLLHAAAERAVVPCIGCNECHMGRPVVCAVNAAAGHERELALVPAAPTRRVVVVGGGPAGLEAARVAAAHGHEVVLFERHGVLGGTAGAYALRAGQGRLVDYLWGLAATLGELGVETHLGAEVGAEAILARSPDVVVLATGADERLPAVPVTGGARLHSALAAVDDEIEFGPHVLVAGALEEHLAPLSLVEALLADGHVVTLTTELLAPAEAADKATVNLLVERLLSAGGSLLCSRALSSIGPEGVSLRDTFLDREEQLTGVDDVVAFGLRQPRRALVDALSADVADIWTIGDCLAPRRLLHATLDGARCGVAL